VTKKKRLQTVYGISETGLTNAFSKEWDNLRAALALYFAWYKFCKPHASIRAAPAMKAGLTNRAWTLAELLAL
jgi:hypothetical protein